MILESNSAMVREVVKCYQEVCLGVCIIINTFQVTSESRSSTRSRMKYRFQSYSVYFTLTKQMISPFMIFDILEIATPRWLTRTYFCFNLQLIFGHRWFSKYSLHSSLFKYYFSSVPSWECQCSGRCSIEGSMYDRNGLTLHCSL